VSLWGGRGLFRLGLPTRDMASDKPLQHLQVIRTVVQGRDVVEVLAPGSQKAVSVSHGDFLQGLQTVGRESGADDMGLADALAAPGRQGLVRVGAQPFLAADAGLEGDLPPLGGKPEGRGAVRRAVLRHWQP